jgi:hypothetical protein
MAVMVGRSAAPLPDVSGAPTVAEGTAEDDLAAPAGVPVLLGDEDPWSLLELADVKSVMAQADHDRDPALDDLGDGTPSPAEEVGLLEDLDDPPALAEPGPRSRI